MTSTAPNLTPPPTTTIIGTVKFYDEKKGFGFLTPETHGQPDTFVHASALRRAGLETLEGGQRVSWTVEPDRKTGKAAAANLRVLG